jgi:hypothetical protein
MNAGISWSQLSVLQMFRQQTATSRRLATLRSFVSADVNQCRQELARSESPGVLWERIAKVITRRTVLELYDDIPTPGLSAAVGLLKTVVMGHPFG